MSDNASHPYSLEVFASVRNPGSFEWAIRRSGKLVQRSDRFFRTEQDARKQGSKEIERLSGTWVDPE